MNDHDAGATLLVRALPTSTQETDELAILKGAVENANEAFVTIDEKHRVIFFNRAAEKIFGYSRNELIGRDLDIILGPGCRKNHRQAVARYMRTRNPTLIGHETEFITARKNGETFPASISFSVAEVEGRLHFTGIVRDVTETKALQKRILRSERLAALGQLVAEIAHEIKNPLMMIGGFARQLLRTARGDKMRLKLNIIAEEVRRLERLLADLSDLYAPKELATEKIEIKGLLEEIRDLTKEDCQARNIALNLDTQKDAAYVEGDRTRLKQVLLNLVKNGMEAVDKGGNISIQSRLSRDSVEITITDDGSGIPEKLQKKILDPFFTTKKEGTGLGLSISKRIIEDHPGSSFTVTSQEGEGTAVKISLGTCDVKEETSPVDRD